jgi:hypothetical protein
MTSLEQWNSGEISSIFASCGSRGISLIMCPDREKERGKEDRGTRGIE